MSVVEISGPATPGLGELFDQDGQVDTVNRLSDASDLQGVEGPNWIHGISYNPSDPRAFHSLIEHLPMPVKGTCSSTWDPERAGLS